MPVLVLSRLSNMYKLLFGDARSVALGLDLPFDSLVTSIPYYGKLQYGSSPDELGTEEYSGVYIDRIEATFDALWYRMKPGSALMLNVQDTYNGYSVVRTRADNESVTVKRRRPEPGYRDKELLDIPSRIVRVLRSIGWAHRATLVWDKGTPGRHKACDRPADSTETILYLRKPGEDRYWDDRYIPSTLIKVARATGQDHPCPWPFELARVLVGATAPIGGWVLDPFAGSGTTLRAAEALGVNAYGIDLYNFSEKQVDTVGQPGLG